MMHASIEEGRAPFARQHSSGLQAAQRRAGQLHTVVLSIAALDVLLTPIVALAPFGFSVSEWFDSQVANWSLGNSVLDWILMALVRDVLVMMFTIWGRSQTDEAGPRRARRVAVIVSLIGLWRLSMLTAAMASGLAAPAVVIAAIAGLALALVTQLQLMARWKVEKLRTAGDDAEPEDEPEEDSQYSAALSYLQTLRVLKPYFWPSTGERSEVLKHRARAVGTWVCVIGSKVCNIVSPIFLARATNGLSVVLKLDPFERAEGVPPGIVTNLLAYAILIFVSKALKELQALVYIKVQQAAYIEIADQTFAHLHGLSLDWHLRKKMGNVIRSLDRGVQAAQQTMQYVCLYLLPTLAEALAISFIFCFHFDNFRLAVFVFLNLALYVYATIKVTLWRKKFRSATTKHDNTLHDRLTDSLVNFETIKYFTAEDYERREYRKAVEQFQKYSMATQASLSFLNVVQQLVINFCLAGGMIIATADVIRKNQESALGDFVAVNTYIVNVFSPLSFLGTIYNMVVNAVVDMHNFGQLLAESHEIQDQPGAPELDLVPRADVPMVEFRDVSFQYKKQTFGRSIKNVSYVVPRGGTTALVGTTGAGKTTMTRLLFRFYDTVAGKVLVNGQDVRSVTQRSLRAAIGMVPQDVVMFNDTIAHNIRYGKVDRASKDEIEKAADQAQLAELIANQPKGYETTVGERGLKLSGGEKQRLAIARCLVKNPPIVVLDEATSALDSETEQRVQQALNLLSESRTVIAIAHRLSTIRSFQQIIVLDSGSIAERGTHETLCALQGSKYAAMWERQAAGIMDDPPIEGGDEANSGSGLGLRQRDGQ